jgi:hypothetical protein
LPSHLYAMLSAPVFTVGSIIGSRHEDMYPTTIV